MALRVSQHSRGYFIFTWCRILYFIRNKYKRAY
nr:MAG TPA: protein of unknown function DUF4111 [Caudoviricetes sp.]DAG95772.1 MAG TPA: protein of unknown function (DUF4111) [Herelleviridae sp.]DAI12094.1 MAG TPA: protein of unknown function (DUF4111) [Bacteriophage sp.]DAG52579.1 MAG TPA: protein of unknown function DUF4111 [Caudoviricetes sp.]DAJ08800.1 MAG TPA: protein of unknown function (DUF4111) [Caudoviricetes sp.]